ncbi:5-oxoprolinase subunit PxpB [Allosediminivita pacifica]|uniref:KipI family sensor histidine kinase inhibitor n=1 Tax=Allosediminivita pacifica TaxID=1267769 RepID=A0A2T6ANH8_9RHOB|nr:5-oxoprolinase subunit PxpB [Allosediminivita pacifica]PTX45374.1 KipI family sensor histidine kinase inhibitor [Allosediminivita pacifica]GGB20770.1 allophanate hydrolase [Allosediminivita pacifica]
MSGQGPERCEGTAQRPVFLPVGEAAISVQFGTRIDEDANRRVIALARALDDAPVEGVLECVPTYRSLLVTYDPGHVRGAVLEAELEARIGALEIGADIGRTWRVPVVYGGDIGMDLGALAQDKAMSEAELVALHSGADYRVYMIGFAPGFAYLGGLPEALHTPRLATPRQSIPAGAIGIGGQQGSINSVSGPSGWRFIGWTPWRAFDPKREVPFLFSAGDRIRFVPVAEDEGAAIARGIASGEITPAPEGDR